MKLFVDIYSRGKFLKSIQITKQTTTIGRAKGEIILPHPLISPIHFTISIEGGLIVIRNRGEGNGTIVGDRPITGAHTLLRHEKINVGPFTISLRLDPPGWEKANPGSQLGNSGNLAGEKTGEPKYGARVTLKGNQFTHYGSSMIPHSYKLKALE